MTDKADRIKQIMIKENTVIGFNLAVLTTLLVGMFWAGSSFSSIGKDLEVARSEISKMHIERDEVSKELIDIKIQLTKINTTQDLMLRILKDKNE